MRVLLAVVFAAICIEAVVGDGKCKVAKVRAVCEAHCEEDTRPDDRTSVPPPGTLLPPTGISQGLSEGQAPSAGPADNATPASASASLLEIESTMQPAIFVEKDQYGKFSLENAAKLANQVKVPASLSDVSSTRLLFPDRDMQNLNEVSASHFASAPLAMLNPPLTCDQVEQHISPVPLLTWIDVHKASFGCADGRSAEEGLGTWGADFAEFLTALNVYEQMATLHLSQADTTAIFRKYLQATSREKFTTCMSGLAIRQFFGSVEDPENAIKNPPEEKRALLWMKIADSNFIGNDHVKFMLENPSAYSVRKELVQQFIHSFFDILWNPFDPLREKLRVQVLPGDHQERAVISVTIPDFCLKQANLAALIAPRLPTDSVVILNPDVVQVFRRELATFFSRETTPVVRADEMNKRFNVLAAGQGALTKKSMYDRIPTYSARITT